MLKQQINALTQKSIQGWAVDAVTGIWIFKVYWTIIPEQVKQAYMFLFTC